LRIKAFYGASDNRGATQAWHGLIGLRARGDYHWARPEPAQNSADSQRHNFRENPNSKGFSNFSDEITDTEPCIQLNPFDF